MHNDYLGTALLAILGVVGLARIVPLILEDACTATERSLHLLVKLVRISRRAYGDVRDEFADGSRSGEKPGGRAA